MDELIKSQRSIILSLILILSVAVAIFLQRSSIRNTLEFVEPLYVADYILENTNTIRLKIQQKEFFGAIDTSLNSGFGLQVFIKEVRMSKDCSSSKIDSGTCNYDFDVTTQFVNTTIDLGEELIREHYLTFYNQDGQLKFFLLRGNSGQFVGRTELFSLVQSQLRPMNILENNISNGYTKLLAEFESNNADIPVIGVHANAPIALRVITVLSIILSSWLLMILSKINKRDFINRKEPWPVIDYLLEKENLRGFEKYFNVWVVVFFSIFEIVSYVSPLGISILSHIESLNVNPIHKGPAELTTAFLMILSIIPTIGNLWYWYRILNKTFKIKLPAANKSICDSKGDVTQLQQE